MENATQALLIAAGVLVGILILSLGIALMHMMGGYAANTQSRIDENQLSQFNNRFLKFQGSIDLNIQDVITVKNYALENNKQYLGYNLNIDRAQENNDYIDVYYGDTKAKAVLILNKLDEELLKTEMDKLQSNNELNSNRLTCEIEINNSTGKVNKIYFYDSK